MMNMKLVRCSGTAEVLRAQVNAEGRMRRR
jgi:hypothetical protein